MEDDTHFKVNKYEHFCAAPARAEIAGEIAEANVVSATYVDYSCIHVVFA